MGSLPVQQQQRSLAQYLRLRLTLPCTCAVVQKVLWAVEVVDRGFSVVWVDLDIVFLRKFHA